jgi:hypothetical protein
MSAVTEQGPDLIWRERMAAQIVAIMQADFKRPGPEEMKEVLKCVQSQIAGLNQQPSPLNVLPFSAKAK